MAKNGSNAFGLRLILFVGIVLVATVIGYFIIRPSDKLPIYHPAQLDQRLVDPSLKGAKGEHRINDFHLTDQFGGNFTLNDVGHRIIVADFFFTTCATICPKMTTQMERVQEAYKDDPRLLLLSHSVTPEMDSVPVLAAYAELHHADPDRWRFLTGDRKQIYALARKSYFAAMDEGDGGPDDFVHTENFVLVDPQRRIRGFYDGTNATDVERLIGDIGKLLEEKVEPE
ncbi:MAG: SCO family protein [Flavobacteriales bacterium]|nr:SCO family protein [Flavobacteriales bacterium]MBK6882810.1 SCO family protein [Flavobacteriales bacterium]